MTKKKIRHAKPKRPKKPKVVTVKVPPDAVLRLEAPKGIVPTVMPTARPSVVDILPVKKAVTKKMSWTDFWLGRD